MIPAAQAHLLTAAQTHPGLSGKNNEDRYAVSAFRLSQEDPTPALLAVLCDGIGGHRAGEVAAELAVNTITQVVAASDGAHPLETLREALTTASREIFFTAQAEPNQLGMGATCACAWVIGPRLYTASVGDSRIYLVREGQIHQLTTDHTWIQEALESGALHPEEVRGHPNAHVIRRFLGSPNPPEVDFRLRLSGTENRGQAEGNQGLRLRAGDTLLLCSDGLSDLVDPAAILAALAGLPLDEAAQRLIDLANAHGGHDNITAVALGVPGQPIPAAAPLPRRTAPRGRWLVLGCAGLAILALAAGILALGFGVLSGPRQAASPTPTMTLPPLLLTVLPGTPQPGLAPPIPGATPMANPTSSSTPFPAGSGTPAPGAVPSPF
ncbi:MAG TPA: protein phosphatase 2C domain-containing protein [Anaerolineaceae bacterium]